MPKLNMQLSDVESARLQRLFPHLPASPASCPTCRGATRYAKKTATGHEMVDCDCRTQWKLHRYLLHCGVPDKYMRYTWADTEGLLADNPSALTTVSDYAIEHEIHLALGRSLILHGSQAGTGKTLLSLLLLKRLLSLGYDGFFTTFPDFLDYWTGGWRDEDEKSWFVRRIRNAEFLVIDDIGKEMRGRFQVAEASLDAVVRSRVANLLPTIITMNLTVEELAHDYSPYILSLAQESSTIIEMRGNGYRGILNARDMTDLAYMKEHRVLLRKPIVFS